MLLPQTDVAAGDRRYALGNASTEEERLKNEKAPMSSLTYSPSGGVANVVGPIAAPEDEGTSFVSWLAAVGAGRAFETIYGRGSQGL